MLNYNVILILRICTHSEMQTKVRMKHVAYLFSGTPHFIPQIILPSTFIRFLYTNHGQKKAFLSSFKSAKFTLKGFTRKICFNINTVLQKFVFYLNVNR